MAKNCTSCKAKNLDIWFDDAKGNPICGKCYVGGSD